MMTSLKRPYAFVYRYDDATWNQDYAEFFRVDTKEELDELIKHYEEEQVYTGACWYVYLLRKEINDGSC